MVDKNVEGRDNIYLWVLCNILRTFGAFTLWKSVHSANLIRAFMLVVPGVLVIGPAVLLTVAPHANLHLLFLVPAIAHIDLIATPCIHGLRTCSYKIKQYWIQIHFVCKFPTKGLLYHVIWESLLLGLMAVLSRSHFSCGGFLLTRLMLSTPARPRFTAVSARFCPAGAGIHWLSPRRCAIVHRHWWSNARISPWRRFLLLRVSLTPSCNKNRDNF